MKKDNGNYEADFPWLNNENEYKQTYWYVIINIKGDD